MVKAANHRAGALTSRPKRPLVPAREDLVQQRAVERHATVLGASIGQNFATRQLVNGVNFARLALVS